MRRGGVIPAVLARIVARVNIVFVWVDPVTVGSKKRNR
jgi:hypothetical protein